MVCTLKNIQLCTLLTCLRPLLCGALCAFALPSAGLWPLMFLGAGLFYYDLSGAASHTDDDKNSAFSYFKKGWLFGFGYFLFGLYWISNALLVEGNDYIWAWPLALVGIPILLSFFTGFATLAAGKLLNLHSLSGFIGWIATFSAFEWLRGHAFTGFPWNLYGYIWDSFLPMAQNASWLGIYSLSAITAFWVFAPGFIARSSLQASRGIIFMAALISFVVMSAWGFIRLETSATTYDTSTQIRIVQANIPQAEKWNPAYYALNLEKHLSLSISQRQDRRLTTIIVWPETALSDYVFSHPTAKKQIRAMLDTYKGNVFLATGYIHAQEQENGTRAYKNSLIIMDRHLNIKMSYDKHHLVPFGEYIPFQKWIPLAPVAGFTGLTKGPKPEAMKIGYLGPFVPLICYEIIFPELSHAAEAEQAKAILNVTNDSWYGDSAGPYQHLTKARFRAIENKRAVIRSANTGISAIIDPYGRIIRHINLNEKGVSTAFLPLP